MCLNDSARVAASILVISLLAACGGSDAPAENIGGTVSGLEPGKSVQLQNEGRDSQTVTTNGLFTFPRSMPSGAAYSVTVSTQPAAQTCAVNNGSGTVGATKISNVSVVCSVNAYAIGVAVEGLTGTGLVLQDNGVDNLSISANVAMPFARPVVSGLPYKVTILTQPAGQVCSIRNGAGTVGTATIRVPVICAALPNAWNWIGGASAAGSSGIYGTAGIAAAGNVPGARYGAISWMDSAGNAWLFGGQGYDSSGTVGALNDLWEYSAGQWKWVGGANTVNAKGTYGSRGSYAAGNVPGARFASVAWMDSAGNFWLWGGQGYDSAGTLGLLNDLWEYSAGQWKWVSGSDTANAIGSYGVRGTAATANAPGARFAANSWIDASGNPWLFGGIGFDATGNQSFLNDLWEYSAGQWKWVSGANTVNAAGTYGTKGIAAPGNGPGARLRAITWIDGSGNAWLFGGLGFDSTGAQGALNDLWEFSAGQWKWLGGSDTGNSSGSYGSQGVAASGNVPSGRYAAIAWMDSAGDVWLFGGQGINSSGAQVFLNDLWEYSAGQWRWVSGSNGVNAKGWYGTKGVPAAGNVAGARYAGVAWIDATDNLWQFGGVGYDSAGTQGGLNDLWKYTP